jgi:hypothetical protein
MFLTWKNLLYSHLAMTALMQAYSQANGNFLALKEFNSNFYRSLIIYLWRGENQRKLSSKLSEPKGE